MGGVDTFLGEGNVELWALLWVVLTLFLL